MKTIEWNRLALPVDVAAVSIAEWRWLIPDWLQPQMVTPFGDIFLADANGRLAYLDAVWGELHGLQGGLADVRAEWEAGPQDGDMFRSELLLESTVLRTLDELATGQCLQFKLPPAVGGEYSSSNVEANSLALHLGLMGQLIKRNRELPAGTPITAFVEEEE